MPGNGSRAGRSICRVARLDGALLTDVLLVGQLFVLELMIDLSKRLGFLALDSDFVA